MDEAHLVSELGEMRHQVGDHLAAVAPRPERPERLGELADRALERHCGCVWRDLAVVAIERRLVVPGVDVADRAGAEDDEQAFGLGREVRCSRCIRMRRRDRRTDRRCRRGQKAIAGEQVRECHAACRRAAVVQEAAAMKGHGWGMVEIRSVAASSGLSQIISHENCHCHVQWFALKTRVFQPGLSTALRTALRPGSFVIDPA